MHSLPKEVRLSSDQTLSVTPVREIEQLRSKENFSALPNDHHGCFELLATFDSSGEVVFATPDGKCKLNFDARTSELVIDHTQSPKVGSDFGHIFKMHVADAKNVRIFFDRSVFEVFADGRVMTSRYFSSQPEKMQATINGIAQTQYWKLGSIWD